MKIEVIVQTPQFLDFIESRLIPAVLCARVKSLEGHVHHVFVLYVVVLTDSDSLSCTWLRLHPIAFGSVLRASLRLTSKSRRRFVCVELYFV